MPNIGFVFFPSDTQPLAFIFSLLGCIGLIKKKGISVPTIVLPFLLMGFIATISAIISLLTTAHSIIDLLRYYYSYISIPIILTYLIYKIPKVKSEVVINVADFALLVAFIGIILQFIGMSWLVDMFVNRAIYVDIVQSNRGFTSFFSEQSRVPIHMAVIFFVFLLKKALNIRRLLLILIISTLSFSGQYAVVVAQISLSILVTLVIYMMWTMKVNKSKFLYSFTVIFTLIYLIILYENIIELLIYMNLPVHGFNRVLNIIEYGGHYISTDYGVTLKISGILHAISSIFDSPFLLSIGAAGLDIFPESIRQTYSVLSEFITGDTRLVYPTRPYTAFGVWMIDFGIIGLIIFIIVHLITIKKIFKQRFKVNWKVLFIYTYWTMASLLKITLSDPSNWVLLSLIWIYANHRY